MRRNLEQVITAGMRARDLVKQILTFSRQGQEELKPLLLQPIINEALRLLRASIPSSIEIDHRIDADCGPVMAVESQIHQVVMNLCTNAYLAMREKGGRLRVELRSQKIKTTTGVAVSGLKPGDYVLLAVEDSGVGMWPDVMQRIFEPYFTTRGKEEGTGLGLSVVHGIVSGHGGKIFVHSTLGQGTLFTIYLPQAKQSILPTDELSEEIFGGTERLLVVDDEEMLVSLLEQQLTRVGYRVVIFNDSQAALAAFEAAPDAVDLVITDMTMPKLSGQALAAQMIAIRPSLPVLLCTGYSDMLDREKVRALGVHEVLMKPILISELAKAIRRALS